ncbi:MAG: TfoX/Sxy family protein [Pseudolabrys sp.]|nr:TfoX/Sxy family protein [Pseudolabrys sp.]
MFGGAGLFSQGLMFGLVLDGQIFLKTDPGTVPAFEAEGCGPFGYDTKYGRRVLTSYWRLPERLYDEPDELAQWARTALGVARAKAVAKASPKKPLKAVPKSGIKRSRTTTTRPVTPAGSKRRSAGRSKAERQ